MLDMAETMEIVILRSLLVTYSVWVVFWSTLLSENSQQDIYIACLNSNGVLHPGDAP